MKKNKIKTIIGSILGIISFVILFYATFIPINLRIIQFGYVMLLLTSGLVTKSILAIVEHEKGKEGITQEEYDTGFIIGKCENILLLSFVLFNAYTALALIFAAKAIIRGEAMKNKPSYYLAGTMINVTYSIIAGIIIKLVISPNIIP